MAGKYRTNTNVKRTDRFLFRLSDKEAQELEKTANEHGLSMQEYTRRKALGLKMSLPRKRKNPPILPPA